MICSLPVFIRYVTHGYTRIIYNEKKIDSILLKPGITGLYKLNTEKLLANNKYDHYYLENYSLLLDIEIIFKTLRA